MVNILCHAARSLVFLGVIFYIQSYNYVSRTTSALPNTYSSYRGTAFIDIVFDLFASISTNIETLCFFLDVFSEIVIIVLFTLVKRTRRTVVVLIDIVRSVSRLMNRYSRPSGHTISVCGDVVRCRLTISRRCNLTVRCTLGELICTVSSPCLSY